MKSHVLTSIVALLLAIPATTALAARPADNTGTFTTVLEEDFSLFTKGTPEAPDGASVIDNGAVLGNIPASLTHTPGWRGAMVYQAGGSAWIDVYKATAQTLTGMVITPTVPNENHNGYWIASIRAKLPWGQADKMEICMSYGQGSGAGTEVVSVGDEWTTAEAVFPADIEIGAVYFAFNTMRSKVLVDDVKIEFFEPYLHAPKALPATGYDGTSFTARWDEVDRADAYLLSVYSKTSDGSRQYTLQDLRVEGTGMLIEGLDMTCDYFYVVKAVNSQYTSPESAEISVKGVTAPVMKTPLDVSDTGFRAEWNAAPLATNYEFWAYVHHTATAPEDYVLTDEKFSKIVSSGTVGSPETVPDAASESLDAYMAQPGWSLYAPVLIDGAVGMDVSFYMSGLPCYLMSPVFDLSQGEGKVDVSFRVWVSDTGTSGHQTQPVVSMLTDSGSGNPETVGQAVVENFTPGRWTDVNVTVGNGTSQSRVMIFPYGNTGYMYVDNLRVVKHLDAGQSILNPVYTTLTTGTEAQVSAAKMPAECWAFRARSYRIEGDINVSDWSDWMHSDATHAGVADVQLPETGVSVYVADGCLTVDNSTTMPVMVCDMYGRTVGIADAGSRTLVGPLVPGIYVAGGHKVAVRR